ATNVSFDNTSITIWESQLGDFAKSSADIFHHHVISSIRVSWISDETVRPSLKPRKVLSNSRNHFEWPKACLSRRVGLRTACARLPFPKVVPVLQIAAE